MTAAARLAHATLPGGQGFWKELATIWRENDTRLLELVFSGFTGGWGLFIVIPWFDAFKDHSAYTFLAHFLPEWVWGSLALGIALLRVFGAVYLIRWIRITAGLLGTFLWGMMTVGVALADPTSPGIAVFGWYTAVCIFLVGRLSWGRGAGEP